MPLKLIADDEPTPLDIADVIHEFKIASDALEEAKNRKDYWQKQLNDRLIAEQHKAATVPYDKDEGKSLRVVRVSNRRFTVDTAGLIKKFGVRATKPLLKDPEVDKSKLDTALSSGLVSKDDVMPFVKAVDHPHVRLYIVDRKEQQEDDRPEE